MDKVEIRQVAAFLNDVHEGISGGEAETSLRLSGPNVGSRLRKTPDFLKSGRRIADMRQV
jgi:hypothetical protein